MANQLWNYSDLARLAPSPEVLQRARGISFALKNWLELAGNEKRIWGVYRGGGEQQYRVAVDLEQVRFFCSCRSPRFPCKHALAMPMLLQRSNEHFRVVYEQPDWVKKAWSSSGKTRKKPKVSMGPTDERLLSIQAGVVELEDRLLQIIENGLALIEREDTQFWEELATRMTDSKLGGMAARLRGMLRHIEKDHWYEQVLPILSDLYLFIQAFKRYHQLSPDVQQELLNTAGVTVRRDRVMLEPEVNDRWMVVGIQEGEESENLYYRRTWLQAEESGRLALLLDFNWNQQGYREEWPLGKVFDATLHFYPGSYPLRAIVGAHKPVQEPFMGLSGLFNFSEWPGYLAKVLAANPWLQTIPCLWLAVRPVKEENRFLLVDSEKQALEVSVSETPFWKIMAVSGGHPISVFCEWEEKKFKPLAIVSPEQVVDLRV